MKENSRFDQSLSCLQEILTYLSNVDNSQTFQKITQLWEEIQHLRGQQHQNIKGIIQSLQESEQAAAQSETQKTKAAEVKAQESAVLHNLSEAKDNLVRVKQSLEDVQENITKCKQEEEKLDYERESVKTQTSQSIPNSRFDVNLYSNITNIRWQFECGPEEINGFVSSKSDVKPFSLNSKQVSKFFIANYLWDLIEEDW